jgi:hypothetical protein
LARYFGKPNGHCARYRLKINKSNNDTIILFFCREIQMATGEWIHDYLNRGPPGGHHQGGGNGVKRNKSVNNGRLYVATQGLQQPGPPTTQAGIGNVADSKKNIKRSWTISSELIENA